MVIVIKEMFANQKQSIFDTRFRYQILATLITHILTCAHGIGLGWLSPTLQKLQSPETPLSFMITVEQASWIGSLLGLGCLMGNIIFGILLDKVGRICSMKILGFPHMIFWILTYFADNIVYLYIARFFGGVTSGGLYIVLPIFVSEISHASIRGTLTSMAMLALSFGVLIGFILSTKLNYFLMPCIIVVLPIIFTIAVCTFPETPQYLLKKSKLEAAERSYKFYNNFNKSVMNKTTNSNDKMSLEFDDLKVSMLHSDNATKVTWADFFNIPTMKIFLTAGVLMILNQFSGSFAFVNYMSSIFEQSGSTMDPNSCTIMMGVIQIIGTCLGCILVDRFGRKLLLLTSAMSMASGMFAFGIFEQFATAEVHERFSWVPLVMMSFVVLTASFGVIALSFTIIVEIMPAKIRSKGTSLCMCFMSTLVFIILKLYPYFLYKLGITVTMYSCAGVCVVCSIYLFIFLKETKGKSMNHD